MLRYFSVFASFLIMSCLGGIYAWSIFVPMMKAQLGFSTAQTQLLIGFTLATFALTMTFSGKLERRFGPMPLCIFSGLALFLSYFLGSLSGEHFWLFFFAFSLLAGLSTGLGYVCALVVPARLFPNQKGLAVGLSVAGFGGGAIFLSYLIAYLQSNEKAISLHHLFFYISGLYATIFLVATPLMRYPGSGNKSEKIGLFSIGFSMRDPRYRLLFFGMFAGSFAGLLVLGIVKPMLLSFGMSEAQSTFGISIIALGNMSGRFFWGAVADRLGPVFCILSAFSILSLSVLLLSFIPTGAFSVLSLLGLIGLSYGAFFVLFPMLTSRIYGLEKLGSVYPFVFLAYGFAGISGPYAAGYIFDLSQSYAPALGISFGICSIGLLTFWLKKDWLGA